MLNVFVNVITKVGLHGPCLRHRVTAALNGMVIMAMTHVVMTDPLKQVRDDDDVTTLCYI